MFTNLFALMIDLANYFFSLQKKNEVYRFTTEIFKSIDIVKGNKKHFNEILIMTKDGVKEALNQTISVVYEINFMLNGIIK